MAEDKYYEEYVEVTMPRKHAIKLKAILSQNPDADVEDVVRCKDCGSYNKHYEECTLHGSHFGENGFCCKGKRMKERF